jgi:hypothetical protein
MRSPSTVNPDAKAAARMAQARGIAIASMLISELMEIL